jgi:hypothetical protein
MTEKMADKWHAAASKARAEAAKDSGELAGVSGKLAPAAEAVKKNVQELVRAEDTLWQAVDSYVDAKSKGMEPDGRLFTALVEYQRTLSAHGPTLMVADQEGLQEGQEQSTKDYKGFMDAMEDHEDRRSLARIGIEIGVFLVLCFVVFVGWPWIRPLLDKYRLGQAVLGR